MSPAESTATPARTPEAYLGYGFAVLAALTFCLIVVGALVRAYDAGLACPDWPLCKGKAVPTFDFEVAFEWGHRVFAAGISVGLLVLTGLARRAPRAWTEIRTQLAWTWAVLVVQVIFGGLTVLLLLAPWTVSVHLVLGNALWALLLWTALDLRDADAPARTALPSSNTVAALLALVALCLFFQVVLGGWVSSHYAGLACPNFPTCDGQHWVPTWEGLIGIHLLHRLNGFVLLGSYLLLAVTTRGSGRVGVLAVCGLALVAAQIVVGVINVLLELPVFVTGLHSALAAAIIGLTAILCREVVLVRTPNAISRIRPGLRENV